MKKILLFLFTFFILINAYTMQCIECYKRVSSPTFGRCKECHEKMGPLKLIYKPRCKRFGCATGFSEFCTHNYMILKVPDTIFKKAVFQFCMLKLKATCNDVDNTISEFIPNEKTTSYPNFHGADSRRLCESTILKNRGYKYLRFIIPREVCTTNYTSKSGYTKKHVFHQAVGCKFSGPRYDGSSTYRELRLDRCTWETPNFNNGIPTKHLHFNTKGGEPGMIIGPVDYY